MLPTKMFNEYLPIVQTRRHGLNTYLHIAFLLKGKRIVAYATNKVGTRTKGSGYNRATIHAEIAVVKKIGDINAIRGLKMVVLRYGLQDKNWVYSHPCKCCQPILKKFIDKYGLLVVMYST